ncbi:MAG: hypothetical protein NTY98_05065, partial [Verrucomicrobia bacterium]|nr:hypothetical protein [Verrucomicrobiota bacterium]
MQPGYSATVQFGHIHFFKGFRTGGHGMMNSTAVNSILIDFDLSMRILPMSLITAENARPGSHDWQLTRMRLDKNEGFRTPFIEGYCSRQSVKAGETLDIF